MNLGMFAAGAASGAAQGFMMNRLGERLKAKKPKVPGATPAVPPGASTPPVAQDDGATESTAAPTTVGAEGVTPAASEAVAESNPAAQAGDEYDEMAGYFKQFSGPNYGQG